MLAEAHYDGSRKPLAPEIDGRGEIQIFQSHLKDPRLATCPAGIALVLVAVTRTEVVKEASTLASLDEMKSTWGRGIQKTSLDAHSWVLMIHLTRRMSMVPSGQDRRFCCSCPSPFQYPGHDSIVAIVRHPVTMEMLLRLVLVKKRMPESEQCSPQHQIRLAKTLVRMTS